MTEENIKYYVDGYLKNVWTTAKKVVKEDWDMVFLVDGMEGVGKSVMAQQGALECDPTFNIDRIVFSPEGFKKAVHKSEKYQAIIYDEAYNGLSSRGAMTPVNRALVSMLAEIRQKNLFVFIVMPTFFDLDRYVAVWRSRALIHVYKDDDWQRGFFAFYDFDRKKEMYLDGKKMYSYRHPKPNFHGKFYGKYVVDVDDYKKKKLLALTDRKEVSKESDATTKYMLFEKVLKLKSLATHKEKWEFLEISKPTFYTYLKKWKESNDLDDITENSLEN